MYSQKQKHMTTTIPALKVNENSVTAGDVFYGTFDTTIKGKKLTVIVSNHIKDLKKVYKFRSAAKCKAGFITISDFESNAYEAISTWKKNSLVNLQVLVEFENGKELWFNVYTTKSNKWHSIDRAFLEVLTVGDMREGYPDMCDMNIWEFVGAKNWADNAFVKN